MTEQEAKKRWCPMARNIYEGGFVYNREKRLQHNSFAIAHCDRDDKKSRCIASDCMMFRWQGRDDGNVIATSKGHIPKDEAHGFCGLAGKP